MANYKEVLAHIATKVGLSTFIERRYGYEQTILASTAQGVATYNNAIEFQTRKLVFIFIDITNVGAGPGTVVVTLQAQDPVSAKWVTLKALAALNAVNTYLLIVGPNNWPADASPLFYFNFPAVPYKRFRINHVVAVNSVTYSIGTVEMEWG